MQTKMQAKKAKFELRDAKVRVEQRRQELFARSSFRESSWISYKNILPSKKFYLGTVPDVAVIFGRSKKVDDQVLASQSWETEVGIRGRWWHAALD